VEPVFMVPVCQRSGLMVLAMECLMAATECLMQDGAIHGFHPPQCYGGQVAEALVLDLVEVLVEAGVGVEAVDFGSRVNR